MRSNAPPGPTENAVLAGFFREEAGPRPVLGAGGSRATWHPVEEILSGEVPIDEETSKGACAGSFGVKALACEAVGHSPCHPRCGFRHPCDRRVSLARRSVQVSHQAGASLLWHDPDNDLVDSNMEPLL